MNSLNSPQLGLRVASTLFGLACLAHLVRLLQQTSLTIGGFTVPVWVSAPGLVVTGLLCFWLWKLSMPAKPTA
ncbi:MAG: hypothetical protein ACOZE5_13530 [Verrucomicrobiota bacterium]